jgi:nucleotide-binding universal stress UspA family protein
MTSNPPFTDILAATDFSPAAGRALQRAAQLAARGGAALHLLHVIALEDAGLWRRLTGQPSDVALRDRLAAQLDTLGRALPATPAGTHIREGGVAEGIVAAAGALGRPLLVMGARGENLLRDLLMGSTTEKVLRKTTCPLLVVRGEASTDYRHVLVPTDFSAHARAALLLAAELAPAARLTLLHVYDAPFEGKLEFAGVSPDDIQAYRERSRADAGAQLADFLATLPAPLRGRIDHELAFGQPAMVVLDRAQALGCDLIAVGKHGRSVVEEWVLGSTTQHVSHHAHGDVLAAHAPA